jgi:hypothetical protein
MGFETLIPAAATLIGGIMGSNSTDNAAASQQAGTQAGIAEQQRQFDLARSDQAPYRAAGTQALGQYQTGINKPTTAADVMSDPGYAFGMQQGQQALDRKAAAAGGRLSGASLKAAQQYGTDYATTGYGAAYQRNQDRLNRLAALAGLGQTATQASASAGSNASNQISGLLSGQGNAAGAAQLAQGNIWGNTMNQLGAIGQRAMQPGYSSQNSLVNGGGFTNMPAYMIQGGG